jgi:hypothetical protein
MQPYTLNDFLSFLAAGIENPRNFKEDSQGHFEQDFLNFLCTTYALTRNEIEEEVSFALTYEFKSPLEIEAYLTLPEKQLYLFYEALALNEIFEQRQYARNVHYGRITLDDLGSEEESEKETARVLAILGITFPDKEPQNLYTFNPLNS